ncbi:MAG: carbamoyltransferase HypF [Alphaproteobacteria bacterium]|jgi:hydrogenase maturation protein HypF|nr:carbamoyltransferase HypF [Alphaproteobacteria bacterium]
MPDAAAAPLARRRVRVRGLVQGVGFRPYVYALARAHGLTGWVLNDGDGVLLEVQGFETGRFLTDLERRPPPLARIDAVEATGMPAQAGECNFTIRESEGGAVSTAISADAAVCPDCLAELFDPADRRYRYPFLNCTHCGPRYTITRRLPYDRPQTAMAGFPLCPDCAREYADPADRRFHAQPVACPACGPRLSLPVEDILAAIRAGRIVGLKGLGGFHLVCDARNAEAVERLRARKHRDAKPFALMVANPESAAALAEIGPEEARLLTGVERPVVLLRRHEGAPPLPEAIAPGLGWLGVMLPYTPLHYLLFHEAAGRPAGTAWLGAPQDPCLVMTSANPGGEPLVIGNEEARQRLAGIADIIVDHDRDIVIRADDSVTRVIAGAPAPLRRARGTVPKAIRLARTGPPVLAVGDYLKTTICVTRGDEAFLSQHIGDLDNAATIGFFEETVAHLLHVLQVEPIAVAHDPHPDVWSTRFAAGIGLPSIAVQHHHAHIAAVLAEHRVTRPALGLALDGVGLGRDGGIWGGELLRVDGPDFDRLGHLRPLALPGGDIAARQPWRMAASALHALGRGDEIPARLGSHGDAAGIARMLDRGINAPLTSSCGRLFDAACGLLGVVPQARYEAEAPMALESLVRTPRVLADGWRIDEDGRLDLLPLLAALIGRDPADGAELFHGTLAAALVAWTLPALSAHDLDTVALGGGCLCNAVLAEGLIAGFAAQGVTALYPRQAPANDGGLALGQAWVAARALEEHSL